MPVAPPDARIVLDVWEEIVHMLVRKPLESHCPGLSSRGKKRQRTGVCYANRNKPSRGRSLFHGQDMDKP